MRIDARDVRRHYESLSDGEILALNRDELTDVAQSVYDEELVRRGLADAEPPETSEFADDELAAEAQDDSGTDDDGQPDWLEDAACACSFSVYPGSPAADRGAQARSTLRAAGIPCHITLTREEPADDNTEARQVINVMVPGALALHATSILDRDLFNDEFEADWRAHLEALANEDLLSLDPRIFCAGFLDRVARMKRAYADEMAARKLKARGE